MADDVVGAPQYPNPHSIVPRSDDETPSLPESQTVPEARWDTEGAPPTPLTGDAHLLTPRTGAGTQMDTRTTQGATFAHTSTITPDTHHIVQTPDGAKVAFPKGTPPDTMHAELAKWWEPHLQRTKDAWSQVQNVVTNAAQALGLPASMPEVQATADDFVRDPIGTTGAAVGGFINGLNSALMATGPGNDENKALVARAQDAWKKGDHLAAAVTLTPLVGDGLAKAVKQAQSRDYSGSLGTTLGIAAPFLTGELRGGEAEGAVTREAAAPYAGAERRISDRTLMSPTEIDAAVKARQLQGIRTPFDVTEGANETIARDVNMPRTGAAPKPTFNMVKDAAGNPDRLEVMRGTEPLGHIKVAAEVPGTWTIKDSVIKPGETQQGYGLSAFKQLVSEAQAAGIDTVESDISNTSKAKGLWNAAQREFPGAVTEENGQFALDVKKAQPATTIGTAEGAARDTQLFAQARTELGPDASFSDVAKRAQELKVAPVKPAAMAARSVGAASATDLETKPDVPAFYSKAEQVIGDKVPNSASGEQISALLKNNGVKADEMKWAGLDDFLKDKPKVSKAELQQFIRENQISLGEEDYGKKQTFTTVPNNAETAHAGEPMVDVIDPKNGLTRFTGTVNAATEYISESEQNRPTKYDKWALPGEKNNYQEKLLTLPTNESPELQTLRNEYAAAEAARNTYSQTGSGVVPGDVEIRFQDAQNAMRKMKNEESTNRDYVGPHWNDQPNVVAHVRFDDRPAVNGKKTLFMEEAQSDWHSAGRHEGYQGNPKEIAAADEKIQQAKAAKTALVQSVVDRVNAVQEHKLAINPQSEQISWQIRQAMNPEEEAQFNTLNNQVAKATEAKQALQGAVPDAPFKQSWHELVMKRMLREAAEKGYDQLAWTTGDQQADLYDLTKHIGRVEYDPEAEELRAYDPKGKKVIEESVSNDNDKDLEKELTPYIGASLAEKLASRVEDYTPDRFYEEGARESAADNYEVREVEPQDEDDPMVYGLFYSGDQEPLETFETKRSAENARADRIDQDVEYKAENFEPDNELPSISGLDLKHGGEFHHLLYDQMIPSFLKKYAKKWGAEVGTTEIKGMGEPTVDYEGPEKTAGDLEELIEDQTKHASLSQSSINKARNIVDEMVTRKLPFKDAVLAAYSEAESSGYTSGINQLIERLGGKFVKSGANQKVHSIPITPAMRLSVMKEGQPIAKKEEQKRPFAAPERNMEAARQRIQTTAMNALA
jgi:hypothetical protein